MGRTIAVEGRSCWRRVHAGRVAFLIDAEAYFGAFAAAAERAERSIIVLGWDVHSGVRLRRDGGPRDLPDTLGDFLVGLLARRPTLHVNVLGWDFPMIYALERQPLPFLRRAWRRHPRLHFRLDGNHPLGASHHQKIVVVDDTIAFVGGFDLAACRWDTPAHRVDDPRRVDPGYGHYPPFHDVQMLVDGEAAAALGGLARDRWWRASGVELAPPTADGDPWPPSVAADVEDVTVAIARTDPGWHGRAPVHEIEHLLLDAIGAARRTIYLETQYLTAPRLCSALAQRLADRDGPEVVIVVPRVCSGWLEEATMGPLRARVLRQLHDADRFDRLRIYHPTVPGLSSDGRVNVHSKLLIVDDLLLRIGSANTSRRSMRLDTECDLVLEAEGSGRVGQAIATFRDRLLAEHLGVSTAHVATAVDDTGSLRGAVERLRGGDRGLVPLEVATPAWLEDLVPEALLIDPEEPVPRHDVVLELLFGEVSGSARGFLVRTVTLVAGVVLLAAIWRWTTIGKWVLWAAYRVAPVRASAGMALAVVAAFVAAGLLFVPATALIIFTALVFGPRLGFAYAMLGSLASALVGYGLGRSLSRGRVRRILGELVHAVSPRLARRAVRSIATGGLVPIAPFTAVNLVAGAAGVDFATFALRTTITLGAGTLLTTLLAGRLAQAIRHPGLGTIAALLGVMLLLLLLGPLVRRRQWEARRG